MVAGGVVYLNSDDHRPYALNAADGISVWNYTTQGISDESLSLAMVNGSRFFIFGQATTMFML